MENIVKPFLANHLDYRSFLRGVFVNRRDSKASYSMRTFARDLGLSASTVSEVMAGRHGLSRAKAEQIAEKLGLSPAEGKVFCDLVESVDGRTIAIRREAQARLAEGQSRHGSSELSHDAFQVIADWYHLAIVELVTTSGFNGDARTIPEHLPISPHQAEMAVDRLCRMGLLKKTGEHLGIASRSNATLDDVPSSAVRQFHRQVLQKAQQALNAQDIDRREVASMIFSVRREDIPEAKKLLKEFRRRFVRQLEEKAELRDEVYCFTSAFFSLHSGE